MIKKTVKINNKRDCFGIKLKELRHRELIRPYLKLPKKTKNVMLYREMIIKRMVKTIQKETGKYPKANADKAALYMSQTYAQYTAGIVQDVAELVIFSEYAETQAEICEDILAERSTIQFRTCTRMLIKQRRKKGFLGNNIIISKILNSTV